MSLLQTLVDKFLLNSQFTIQETNDERMYQALFHVDDEDQPVTFFDGKPVMLESGSRRYNEDLDEF